MYCPLGAHTQQYNRLEWSPIIESKEKTLIYEKIHRSVLQTQLKGKQTLERFCILFKLH